MADLVVALLALSTTALMNGQVTCVVAPVSAYHQTQSSRVACISEEPSDADWLHYKRTECGAVDWFAPEELERTEQVSEGVYCLVSYR